MAEPRGAAARERSTGTVLTFFVFQDLSLFEKEEAPGSTPLQHTISTWGRTHPSLKFVLKNKDYIKMSLAD